jgi:chromate transport protein ChrA
VIVTVRYVLPAVLLLVGIALLVIQPNSIGIEGLAMAVGAALALLLLNILFRAGVQGDRDRDREDAAREYFAAHGRWPDEER